MDCVILYLLLFSWTIIFIINKNKYWVVFCLSLVLSLFLFNYSKNYQIHKNELSYESIDNKPIIKLQEDNKNYYYNFNCINNDILESLTLNKKGNYMITRCKPSFQYINKVNTKLLVLNEYNINTRSDLKNFKDAEYLLLVNSPFINFRLIKEELPLLRLVLFDRSNKKAYINTWKKLCYRYNIKYLYGFKDFKFIE